MAGISARSEMTTKERIKTTEYLSQDILEEDFMKVFSYLLKAQMLLGTCRVDARDRFISVPTVRQKLYTVILLIITLTAICSTSTTYWKARFPDSYPLQRLAFFFMSVTAITYCCYTIHARFRRNDDNVKLYLKMQKIDRLMGIEHNKIMNNMLQRANCIAIWFTLGIFTTLLIVTLAESLPTTLAYTGVAWTLLTIVFEMLLCSNLLIYFFTRIRLINSILINFVEGQVILRKPDCLSGPFIEVLRYVAARTRDYTSSHIDVYLKAVLECFTDYQDLYRFPVAMYFVSYLCYTLGAVQFAIFGLKYNLITNTDLTLLPIMMVSTFCLGFILIIRIEFLNREIKETKRLTVMVMSLHFEGSLRAKAKRMCKMIEESPPSFSVYEMWHVNAVFIVRFFNVISTLVVSILQFTVL